MLHISDISQSEEGKRKTEVRVNLAPEPHTLQTCF
jgi:hypothetical protein